MKARRALVEVAVGHPAAADDEQQTGPGAGLIAGHQPEGVLGDRAAASATSPSATSRPASSSATSACTSAASGAGSISRSAVASKASTRSWTSSQRPAWCATQAAARVRRGSTSEHVGGQLLRPFAQRLLPALPDEHPIGRGR